MSSEFKKAMTVADLENVLLPTLFYIEEWLVQRFGDGTYTISDGTTSRVQIRGLPAKITDGFAGEAGLLIGVTMVVKASPTYSTSFNSWGAPKVEVWYHVPEEKKCECGSSAVGSNYHSGWCPKYTKGV